MGMSEGESAGEGTEGDTKDGGGYFTTYMRKGIYNSRKFAREGG